MPTASTAPHPTRLRGRRPAAPRRTSGPGRAVAGAGSVALEPLGARLVRRTRALPDAPLLDRLIRGRLWIGVLAVALLGVVFLQVSLLKLNTGIGRAVQSSQTLELQNVELRRQIAQADQGDQLQDIAGAKGMVMPAPGDVGYVDAGTADAARAAANITEPNDPATVAATQQSSAAVAGTAAVADAATPPVAGTSSTASTPAAAPAAAQAISTEAPAAAAPTASTATPATAAPSTAAPATAAPDATSAAATATPVTP